MTRKLDIQRKKDEEDYYAPDSQVAAALDQVAKHRTDIFGIEETGVGRKIGEERKIRSEIGWNGHAKTADQDCDIFYLSGVTSGQTQILYHPERQLNRDTRLMMRLHVNDVRSLTRVFYQRI